MAMVAGLISAGTAAYGAYSAATADAPAGGVGMPQMFQMPHMGEAANAAYSGIQNLPGQQQAGQVAPQYQQTGQNLYNNPYAQMYQQGGNAAGPWGMEAAQGAFQAGQQLQGAGTSLIPGAQSIMQTAFDPQKELYARTAQTVQDQTRAGQAARGVATTPFGAAGEADNMRKFNIDWQNNQLARQSQGGQAAGALLGQAGNVAGGGASLSAGAVPQYVQSAGIPYSTYNTIGQGQFGALNSQTGGVQGAQSLAMNPVEAYLKYLGIGNQSNQVANQTAQVGLQQAQLGFNQSQTLGSQFGQSMSGLSRAVGQGNWNWLGNMGGGSGSSYNPGPQATWGY